MSELSGSELDAMRAKRKARIEEVRERFTAQVRRVHGPEMTVEFHPDALLEMFEGGQLDVPDDEWEKFLTAFDEGTFEPADEDERPEEIAEARKRARDLLTGKRPSI